MKNILLLFSAICLFTSAHGQLLFSEDFESGSFPEGWETRSNATDGGWRVLTPNALSSFYFGIAPNGSGFIAGTNDDQCNCDKSNEYFISPPIDLSQVTSAILMFDGYYGDGNFQNIQEDATIEVSTDKVTWTVLSDLEGNPGWTRQTIDLSSMAGQDEVYIGFRYHDNGSWLFGFAIDNIVIETPPQLEVEFASINAKTFGEIGSTFNIGGSLINNGIMTINTIEMSYSVNGETPINETLTNLNIPGFSSYDFNFSETWTADTDGIFTIDVQLNSFNGMNDENPDNNSLSYTTTIYAPVLVPNKIDDFLLGPPEVINMSDARPFLNRPTDLDFFPIAGKDELWVVNQRTESDGGSTLTISDAALSTPSDYLSRVDGNAWHFMSLPTGIALSPENYNFATSAGVLDANHNGGTFTGPTLWSSDPLIYAQPSGGNGSHLDMLHGSPFGMGIAHEVDNVFWVYDNFNKDIVRYDFQEDHGPGNDDHADGIVRRFKNTGINAESDIPNHLVLDKETGWLYFVDNGNDRVVRLDINSGSVSFPLALINEDLAEHTAIQGYTMEVIATEGLDQPCGIEIFENRLLVGEYSNGDIRVYDMDNNFEFMGVIPTDNPGLTGIKVGPDGNIWYTNRLLNQLNYVRPGDPVNVTEIVSSELKISPNPTSGLFTINLGQDAHTSEKFVMTIQDSQGKEVMRNEFSGEEETFDLSGFSNGVYLVYLRSEKEYITQKLVVSK